MNLNADLFGRGTIIASHGSDEADMEAAAAASNAKSGFRGFFTREPSLRRQIVGRRGRPGIPTVMIEAFNVMQDRITRARLAGDPADVLINPRLGGVGWFDFHRGKEAIEIGAEAAERSLESINEAIAALSQMALNGNGAAK